MFEKNFLGFMIITVGIALVLVFASSCMDDGAEGNYNNDGNDDPYNGNSSVWLWASSKNYTVTDGVVGNIDYEYNATWISYADNKHYEQQYSYTYTQNTYTENEAYTYSRVSSQQVSVNSSRNGNTSRTISHQITDYTTTIDYVNPLVQDSVTRTTSDITSTTTSVYDEEIGLTRSYTLEQTGTQNGSPYNSYSGIYYTLELSDITADGVKTYKSYNSTTDGTGNYNLYKVKNGITLENKTYTNGELYYTTTYIFPENSTIRTKIPAFTTVNTTYESTPANNSYQTCEVMYDSSTELTIRVKTYTAGILRSQYETTYKPRNFIIN